MSRPLALAKIDSNSFTAMSRSSTSSMAGPKTGFLARMTVARMLKGSRSDDCVPSRIKSLSLDPPCKVSSSVERIKVPGAKENAYLPGSRTVTVNL